MFDFRFNHERDREIEVLCLGAHSDDIEIGCGGTISRLIKKFPGLAVHWVVFSSKGIRGDEALESANVFLKDIKNKKILIEKFRDGFFPYMGDKVKEYFEQLKNDVNPDIIFTHYRQDFHQDHRLIADLTWNTFRDHLILEYEIPKYDGDLGAPNFFVHLDEQTSRAKADHLVLHFGTQTNKHWFTRETFLALLRLRGVESRSPEGYAEAFYCRKVIY
ncbi:MAG: PIG-L domain-containing protein [Anaerolineae bacterium]|nr:hypothetical protein [Anaerolineales bacterium]RIK30565.1 MAG: PIG-L domain-containing protein [Anaerolineae bacterium]WKZ45158.1 MAG: PIG-L deacetylase family protein [Anaerolineales bacterium]WKZ47779.1 MAG: PIG-L deacetylase family protein [Anaerolineales bacterium]